MKWFTNFAIKWKLAVCFGLIGLCLVVVIAVALATIENISNDLNIAIEARQLRIEAESMRLSFLMLLLGKDSNPQISENELADVEKNTSAVNDWLQRLKAYFRDDTTALELISDLESNLHQYCTTRDSEQIPLIRAHEWDKARTISLELQAQRFDRIAARTLELADHATLIARARAD